MISQASLTEKEILSVFSHKDYYPVPSLNVISYSKKNVSSDLQGHRRSILQTDLDALLVSLTSPMDPVDYSFFSDFFLIYRKFLSSIDLLNLLIRRFHWCLQEISEVDDARRKIGEIVIVRTFVLLRHWLVNYFAQDFLDNSTLRENFLHFINFIYEQVVEFPNVKLISGIIINLKKAWAYNVKIMWEGVDLAKENNLKTANDWLYFYIRDVTMLTDSNGSKRKSTLSFYALQSFSNPNFRNESILSLYKPKENFQLPQNNGDIMVCQKIYKKGRTASMFLFPQNNLNIPNILHPQKSDKNVSIQISDNLEKMSYIPKPKNVSNIMKDIEYPSSPSIDVIIPPTPAKKVEFILRSSYLPSDLSSTNQNTIHSNSSLVSGIGSKNYSNYRGISGLLTKWKNNHTRRDKKVSFNNHFDQQHQCEPDIENLIKFVFSITSLEKEPDIKGWMEAVSLKFDILSARTIDEVEYLVSVENELLKKLEKQKLSNISFHEKNYKGQENQGFSVMDNLNLYKTVSSIANSVLSISHTLNHQQTISPLTGMKERQKIHNLSPTMSNKNTSQYSIMNALMGPNVRNSPKKLVFHGGNNLINSEMSTTSNSCVIGDTRILSRGPTNTLDNTVFNDKLSDIIDNDSTHNSCISIVSYDSNLSNMSEGCQDSQKSAISFGDCNLKRKNSANNLREFNFEEVSGHEEEIKTIAIQLEKTTVENYEYDKTCDNAGHHSFVTSYGEPTDIFDNLNSSNSSKASDSFISSASGRISITKSCVMSPSDDHLRSPEPSIISSFSDHEVLSQNENQKFNQEGDMSTVTVLDGEMCKDNTSCISSDSDSITTNLFLSAHGTPNKTDVSISKTLDTMKSTLLKLSSTPSMHSITSNESVPTFETFETDLKESKIQLSDKNESQDHCNCSFDESNTKKSFTVSIGDDNVTKNKYLFLTDNGSIGNDSPQKNLDNLKNKFIGSEYDHFDNKNLIKGEYINNKSNYKQLSSNEINESNLVSIGNVAEIFVEEDPVNIALMKLEGKYNQDNGIDPNNNAMTDKLVKQVYSLDLKELSPPTVKSARRQSMFIERRRTLMSPLTPRAFEGDMKLGLKSSDQQIRELLQDYKLQDPRLNIKNNSKHVPFILMYDSLSIANQMTLIEREIMMEVDWKDLLDLNMEEKLPIVTSWLQLLVHNEKLSGIDLAVSRFNLTVNWIISEIVMTTDVKLRRNAIQRFIHVAEHCKTFQNYNTLMQIVLALSSIIVQKYTDTWRLIEPGDLLTWEGLKNIGSLDKNYSVLRQLLNSIDPIKGCIPFIVLYLSDLSLNFEKKDWIVPAKILNYSKFERSVQIVKNFIQRVQWSKFYDISPEQELLSKCVYITSLSHEEIKHLTVAK